MVNPQDPYPSQRGSADGTHRLGRGRTSSVAASRSVDTLVDVSVEGDTEARPPEARLLEDAREDEALRLQKIQTAVAERGELRAFNSKAALWMRLPLRNGDPFPQGAVFPRNITDLRHEMSVDAVRELARLYDIPFDSCSDTNVRDQVALFLAGLRA